MKSLVTLLFIIGFTGLVVGYIQQLKKCPPPKIEYKYIPRTFQEEQENPIRVSRVFTDMFEEPSSWVNRFSESKKHTNQVRY